MGSETVAPARRGAIDRIWFSQSPRARALRAVLAPLAAVYGGIAAVRRGLYDRRLLPTFEPAIPAISVGNLTVGGTGKTPIAAWLAATLADRGQHPGLVLRAYGDGDEAAVHRILNPTVPIITDSDRVAGIAAAAAEGCDVAVLDDAFQHRRVRRALDLVLVSADSWRPFRWLLPAGPWREPVHALRRASMVVITRKSAPAATVAAVQAAVSAAAPGAGVVVASIVPDLLRTLGGDERPITSLGGSHVRAVAGIGWPPAFFEQLAAAGAEVDAVPFPDHHRYSVADVARIRRYTVPGATTVCTLKDAVKLGPLWPREGEPLWYVSQRVEFDFGVESLLAALDAIRRIRPVSSRSSASTIDS
ncbi:MAG: tetraacyldisaccharide 4'-kinase [Gemmatimonadales bacterium]|jgi:tetraacyldisaccharide 4'-kinase